LEELIDACLRFKNGRYSIEDLYRRLSWIGVPNEYVKLVSDAERHLELIRFTELEENWQSLSNKVVDHILESIGYK